MKKAVFDTNVWVSALGFHGRVRFLLDPIHREKFEVAVSPDILEETAETLSGPKFRLSPEALAAVDEAIRKIAKIVRPVERLQVVKADPDDDRVLECAVESDAEIIVSGDSHLLDLGTFRGIRILTPAAFLEELEGESGPPIAHETPAVYEAVISKKPADPRPSSRGVGLARARPRDGVGDVPQRAWPKAGRAKPKSKKRE